MDSIEDLITDHNESNFLDFKKEDYSKEKKYELLKDIIAFANADHVGDRFIILGVNEKADPREFFDIENILDSASLLEFVHNNINPELNVDIYRYEHQNKKLAIIQIINPTNKPYEVKKNYTFKTEKGDKVWDEGKMFVRVGTTTKLMSRKYLDKIYASKTEETKKFDNKIKINFFGGSDTLNVKSTKNLIIPSQKAEFQLLEMIEARIALREKDIETYSRQIRGPYQHVFQNSSVEMLENSLKDIKNVYEVLDAYYLEEETAIKVQIEVFNSNTIPLENVIIKIKQTQEIDGFYIPLERPQKYREQRLLQIQDVYLQDPPLNLPDITFVKNLGYTVTQKLNQIKHKLAITLFTAPFRMVCSEELIGKTITLELELHADNLPDPQYFKLYISVT